jgi:hypothetical protein
MSFIDMIRAFFIREPLVKSVSEPLVESVSDPPVESVSEPPVESVSDPLVESVSEPPVESVSEPLVESVSEPLTIVCVNTHGKINIDDETETYTTFRPQRPVTILHAAPTGSTNYVPDDCVADDEIGSMYEEFKRQSKLPVGHFLQKRGSEIKGKDITAGTLYSPDRDFVRHSGWVLKTYGVKDDIAEKVFQPDLKRKGVYILDAPPGLLKPGQVLDIGDSILFSVLYDRYLKDIDNLFILDYSCSSIVDLSSKRDIRSVARKVDGLGGEVERDEGSYPGKKQRVPQGAQPSISRRGPNYTGFFGKPHGGRRQKTRRKKTRRKKTRRYTSSKQ